MTVATVTSRVLKTHSNKPENLTDITFTITITPPEAARTMRLIDVLYWRTVFLWRILSPLPAIAIFTFIASDVAAFPYCAGMWIVAVCLFYLPASLRFRWFLRKHGGNPDELPSSVTVHLTDDDVTFTPNKLVNVEEIKLYHLHDTLFFMMSGRMNGLFCAAMIFPAKRRGGYSYRCCKSRASGVPAHCSAASVTERRLRLLCLLCGFPAGLQGGLQTPVAHHQQIDGEVGDRRHHDAQQQPARKK